MVVRFYNCFCKGLKNKRVCFPVNSEHFFLFIHIYALVQQLSISRKDRPRSMGEDRRDLGEEAVFETVALLTNGENGNCEAGNNHDSVV